MLRALLQRQPHCCSKIPFIEMIFFPSLCGWKCAKKQVFMSINCSMLAALMCLYFVIWLMLNCPYRVRGYFSLNGWLMQGKVKLCSHTLKDPGMRKPLIFLNLYFLWSNILWVLEKKSILQYISLSNILLTHILILKKQQGLSHILVAFSTNKHQWLFLARLCLL